MSEENSIIDQAPVADAAGENKPQGPELTVQDLNALKAIIDVASQRGAFKPNEMMTVGQTYSKLEQFLLAVGAQQAQPTPGTPAEGA